MKLTSRELMILKGAADHGLSSHGGEYYRLGGHGCVPVRYHPGTLPSLVRRGLVERGPYWRATAAGRKYLEATAND